MFRVLKYCQAVIFAIGLSSASQTLFAADLTIRPKVEHSLSEVQDLISQKKYSEALLKLSPMDELENLNAAEITMIERTRAVVALNLDNLVQTEKSLARVIQFGVLTEPDRGNTLELLISTYNRNHDYDSAIAAAEDYLVTGGASEKIKRLQVQSNYLAAHFDTAAKLAHSLVDTTIAEGHVPSENLLKIEAGSYLKIKNSDGYTQVLMRLVQYFPSTAYWQDLLERIRGKAGYSAALQLDSLRLQNTVGALQDGEDYLDMATLAMKAGYPAEAKFILAQGDLAHLFAEEKMKSRLKSMDAEVEKACAEDAKQLSMLSEASRSKTGVQGVNNGLNLVLNGQLSAGILLMEKALDSSTVRQNEEAHLHFAYALYLSGDHNRAKLEFERLRQASPNVAVLAQLWLAHIDKPTLSN